MTVSIYSHRIKSLVSGLKVFKGNITCVMPFVAPDGKSEKLLK